MQWPTPARFKIFPVKHCNRGGTQGNDGARDYRFWGGDKPPPADPAGQAELVQPLRRVILHFAKQHFRFPCGCGQFHAVQESSTVSTPANPRRGAHYPPVASEEEPLKIFQRYRLYFRAQTVQGPPMNSRQQPAVAPFQFLNSPDETSAQDKAFRFQSQQSRFNFRIGQPKIFDKRRSRDWANRFHAAPRQFA